MNALIPKRRFAVAVFMSPPTSHPGRCFAEVYGGSESN